MTALRLPFDLFKAAPLCPTQLRLVSRVPVAISRRYASTKKPKGDKKKKKARSHYLNQPLSKGIQFSLCDAIRYIKAFEVGQVPTSAKYDLAVRLQTLKNSPVVRNRTRLPYPPDTSARICVICPPNTPVAKQATAAGAALVGEDEILESIKAGKIEFDRCICHVDSVKKLQQANVGRILGPRGLMPNEKMNTITSNVGNAVRNMVGATEYKETLGVVRCAVGQLGFTPEQLQQNIRSLMASVKKDMTALSDQVDKKVHEVVLSSTHSPGFSLNGDFRSEDSLPTEDLSVT